MTRPRALRVASSCDLRSSLCLSSGELAAVSNMNNRHWHWRHCDYSRLNSSHHWVRHGDCDCVDNRNDSARSRAVSLASWSDGPRCWRSTALLLTFIAGASVALSGLCFGGFVADSLDEAAGMNVLALRGLRLLLTPYVKKSEPVAGLTGPGEQTNQESKSAQYSLTLRILECRSTWRSMTRNSVIPRLC